MRSSVAKALLVAYVVFVAVVVLWPTPIDSGQGPLIARVLGVLHGWGVPSWFNYTVLEFSANVGIFVPLAFLLGLVLPTRLRWVPFLAGPAASVAIEVGQSLFLPGRFATPWDVLANSLGAVVGGVLAISVHRALDQRTTQTLD